MYKSCLFKRFSTIFTALFFHCIAHEQTAQNLTLSVRSSLFALFLTERHRSQNAGSLKSEERLSDFKERCAQLCRAQNGRGGYCAIYITADPVGIWAESRACTPNWNTENWRDFLPIWLDQLYSIWRNILVFHFESYSISNLLFYGSTPKGGRGGE